MVKKGSHTHKKKLCILLARKFCQNTRNKKLIKMKKKCRRPSDVLSPLPVIEEASKRNRTHLLVCWCRQKLEEKKIPIQKWNLMMKTKNINCAWRDTLYLLHSWRFFREINFTKKINFDREIWFNSRGQYYYYYYPRNKMFFEVMKPLMASKAIATSSKP